MLLLDIAMYIQPPQHFRHCLMVKKTGMQWSTQVFGFIFN